MSSLGEHASGMVVSSNFPQRLTLMVLLTSRLLTHFHTTQNLLTQRVIVEHSGKSLSQKMVNTQLASFQLKVLTWWTAACPTASCHGWVPTGDRESDVTPQAKKTNNGLLKDMLAATSLLPYHLINCSNTQKQISRWGLTSVNTEHICPHRVPISDNDVLLISTNNV